MSLTPTDEQMGLAREIAKIVALAVEYERERCVEIIRNHRPDASFDDSATGVIERQSLLSNIIDEIRLQPKERETP